MAAFVGFDVLAAGNGRAMCADKCGLCSCRLRSFGLRCEAAVHLGTEARRGALVSLSKRVMLTPRAARWQYQGRSTTLFMNHRSEEEQRENASALDVTADRSTGEQDVSKTRFAPPRWRTVLVLALWGAALGMNALFVTGLPSDVLLDDAAARAFFQNLLDPSAVNPIFWGIFNLLGVWPMIMGAMVGSGRHAQSRQYTASWLSSFALGAYALAPYLALRTDEFRPDGPRTWQDLDTRPINGILLASSLFFMYQGIGFGAYPAELLDVAVYAQWINFVLLFKQSALVHIASLDFVLFWSIFPILQVEDMKRRGLWQSDAVSNWATVLTTQLVPVIGPLVYLLSRPPMRFQSTKGPQ